ncbi:MAG: sulfatase-like hydrolase/transferase [Anaerolineae bacterium]|nr:sulfatase-like hydrolase/transferase [Anaerolineae bacterium]
MPNPPNFVFIVGDQWRGDCLGAARSVHPVMTPHFDQLAAEGLRFRQAYADCPICMPQRATFLTGQTATRFRMPFNFLHGPRTPVDLAESLPARLSREAGYQTKAIGKMHFYPERARLGFEHITLHPNDYVNWLEDMGYGGQYRGHGLGGNEFYPATSAVPDRFTHTAWIIEESVRFLSQRDPEVPFFLLMIFEAPHAPFDPPPPYDRLYDAFTIPAALAGDWPLPPALRETQLSHKTETLSPEVLRAVRQRYYGQITHIDYLIGRFLGELGRLGLDQDTVIVFTADHGEHLGDFGLFGKYTFLGSAARIPLILRVPGMAPAVREDPVMTADIAPTLLALAGLPPNPSADGVNLHTPQPERLAFGETRESAFCTDGRLKYIYYARGAWSTSLTRKTTPMISTTWASLTRPSPSGRRCWPTWHASKARWWRMAALWSATPPWPKPRCVPRIRWPGAAPCALAVATSAP